MPAEHDLDPDAMTEAERLAKRRYEAWFAFETQPRSEWLEAEVHAWLVGLYPELTDGHGNWLGCDSP